MTLQNENLWDSFNCKIVLICLQERSSRIASMRNCRLPRFLAESRKDRGIRHEDRKPERLLLRHCEKRTK
ncbi:hypothetical protein [Helicobacter rodentium]|uniref:hypothetical protein n=1 Tax=Helicobacter rodentium TaxID=59617 RepID=UPI00235443E5|nr:hypothetical protein [Helicobacter rodentium]